MKLTREHIIWIAAIITVGSLISSFIMGWFIHQLPYLIIGLVITGVVYFLIHKKAVKRYQWEKARGIAEPVFRGFAGPNYSIKRFFRITDGKRFSTTGKLWAFFAHGSSEMAALVDYKTGEIIGGESDITNENSPIKFIYKEPPAWHLPRVRGSKVKTEYKREEKAE